MTTFAEKHIAYPDGQLNVAPLPEAIMLNGFTPETRDAPGMPLAAQYLNWLFRDLYRQVNMAMNTADNALIKKANLADLTDPKQAIKNLGLIDQLLPAWAPIACPFVEAPVGYLKCNGATFDKTRYPELAKGYPSGVLPDLRGEFIRGWDDGRGVDAGRVILEYQSDSIKQHSHMINYSIGMLQPGTTPINILDGNGIYDYNVYTENSLETRPRNIAFLYIVRAS